MIEFWIRAAKAYRWIGTGGVLWGKWWGKRASNADARVFARRWRMDEPGYRTWRERLEDWLVRDEAHHAERAAQRRARRHSRND